MLTRWMLAALLVLGAGTRAGAGEPPAGAGALHALDTDGRVLGGCPLERTDVKADLSGFVGRVTVTQVFGNPYTRPIEALYTFPLSERAAVDSMTIRIGGREIRGEIRTREEARRTYDAAKASGKLAGLLDEERPNIFTQALANVMPGDRVEVTIEYVEPLRFEGGTFEFVFPTVVGPRFIPGGVPDADRITPPVTPEGTRAGHDIAIEARIDAGLPIQGVESRLHAIDVERPAPSRAVVRLAKRREIPNRDFVLRYAVAGGEVASGYLAHRPQGRDGYVTFVLVPPKRVTPETAAPKEMVFVVDRSGSQSGLPLTKAKETMLWILERLHPDDTFQVIDFSSRANRLFDRPQRATVATKREARAYIQALEADGGTMMAEAIREVASTPADGHRLRIVTFMTDGYVGNDFEVIDLVRRTRGTSRWFPFGTGNSVNRFLIDAMAKQGGGEAEYVRLDEPGETVARKFYERVASPVLTDVRLAFEGLDVDEIYPVHPSDVWAERPLVVHARYRTPGRGLVILQGYRQGRPFRQALDVTLPAQDASNAAVASMWARARVEDLMARDLRGLQTGEVAPAVRDRIIEVALAHRLLTRFTSFVAVEDRVVNRDGTTTTVSVPLEMPQGVTYEGVFGGRAMAAQEAEFFRRSSAPTSPLRYQPGGRPALADAAPAGTVASLPKAQAPLGEKARTRLAPELQALLGGASVTPMPAVADGRVEVKVRLSVMSRRVIERLESRGLRVKSVAHGFVIGSVAVEDLTRLSETDGVVRIEAA